MSEQQEGKTRRCPFSDCDWSYEYEDKFHGDSITADYKSELHYEREHAGRIRVQVTLESEQLIGSRDPKQVRQHFLERYEELVSMDVAHVRTEVLEEADDHSKLEGSNDEQYRR